MELVAVDGSMVHTVHKVYKVLLHAFEDARTGLLGLPGAASGASGSVRADERHTIRIGGDDHQHKHSIAYNSYLHLDPYQLVILCVIPRLQSILD